MTLLSLRAGRLAVDLAPEAGGSIARFAMEGVGDLLRPASNAALATGTGKDTACYPLVPFSNRIANGRLAIGDEVIQLRANWPGVRHPMHGDGWAQAWNVVHHDPHSAELAYVHARGAGAAGWPFCYRARQTFALHETGLTVGLSIQNLEDRDVPAGLGLHPFFVCNADTELACRLAGVWRTDPEVLPLQRVPVPAEWDFSRSRRVDGMGLDHCFDGWDGEATVTWPQRGLRLVLSATEAFRHLVIYVPDGQRYFCVEPVSHANGAVGQTRLTAGATLGGEISFRLVQI
ncbi:MAG: aldose 1-epimerase [Reyranella sp.]|uniref:aldose 1-epimerase n=1 Tax=Reyranella sp. TaxID=1929291 RepID=UPI001217D077|nr:aldose 1-epimerase [Reyranella sp.]TAJ98157.1 MAG: aldose 1-epimerase [Reyranella sp.]TBR28116.1 MAG: aldose 1-epimerase [Reyranella sp.]